MNVTDKTILVAEEMGKLLTGKFTGKQHFAKACQLLAGTPQNAIVTLDFTGADYISASWINWMLFPLMNFAADENNDFYVLLKNLPSVAHDELQLVAEQNRQPIVGISDGTPGGTIYGSLDPGQRETLEKVLRRGEVTGAELASKSVSGAAWNNRLRDLNLKRLLRRRRDGREQIYSPIISEVKYNG